MKKEDDAGSEIIIEEIHNNSDEPVNAPEKESDRDETVPTDKYDATDTDSVLDTLTYQVFSTENRKDVSVDISSQTQTFISEYMNFIYNGSEITRNYHLKIMKQAQTLLTIFAALFVGTTIYLCGIIGAMVFTKISFVETLIPLISGAMVDMFSGVLIVIMKNLLKSRDDFFRESVKAEHFSKIVGLIQTINNDSDKVKLISKIVDDYCEDNQSPCQ